MKRFLIGVDLGGTNLRCALIDENHQILGKRECPTLAAEGPQAVIGRMIEGIRGAAADAGVAMEAVSAVGIGVPAPLNQELGVVYSAPNMRGWENVPLARIVRDALGVASFIENDANCAGWGEYVHGAGAGCRHMMMITLGTGVGGAIIIDGKLHIGRDGAAGELGHVCIVDGGRLCGCGARGCIEAYASATAVVGRFRELLEEGWHSPLAAKRDALTSYDVFQAGIAGDAVAMRIVEQTGHFLGVMASSVAELLNPERCVVSGGMIQAGSIIFDAMRNTCLHRNQHPGRTMEILPAALGPNAGLIGAADHAKIRLERGT